MAKYKRVKGGEKNAKTGVDWTRPELEKVYDLYIEIGGTGIHERNPKIHELAKELGRTVRSVENQLLGFRKIDKKETGRQNYNRLIPVIWRAKTEEKSKPLEDDFHFRISSALKDIIGRDLITDEYIAVFELVKNSYDAYATQVDIYFENIYSDNADDSKIVIKDNGKGMNRDDLINKWLFVAYSAKRENEEDESFDYRDNIYSNRPFAGAKGIGRFSCDRLGAKLYLETIKKEKNPKIEVLVTDWGDFEENSKAEFINIGVEHKTKLQSDYDLKHGTVLEITNLRTTWDRDKLKKLKLSLAKLINPNRGKGEQHFSIKLHVDEELEKDTQLVLQIAKTTDEDEKVRLKQEVVNGYIENFIFETLGLKTTRIWASISEDGKYIDTTVIEGGTLIYKIKEENKHYNLLDNIDCTLYYLNHSAKLSFNNRMGIPSKDYGHVFLYKNNFRIYPYGEPSEDPLGIDLRKAQGVRRFLGTRELIGQIEIYSDTDRFRETSSRGDGLIKNDAYHQLEKFFLETLRRLEYYVVKVQKWGLSIEDVENDSVKSNVADLLANLTNSKNIVEFQTPDNFIDIIEKSQSKSAKKVLLNLKKVAVESGNDELLNSIEDAEKQLEEINAAKEEAEKEAEEERKKAEKAEKALKEKESENLFLKSIKSQDLDEVVSFLHHAGIYAGTIDGYLKNITLRLSNNLPVTNEKLLEIVKNISFEAKKIMNITSFATKANFKLITDYSRVNICNYIDEYIRNIIPTITDKRLKIKYTNNATSDIVKEIKPIELNIVIDNIINNARKAGAENVNITLSNTERDKVLLEMEDDGKGIPEENKDKIYEFGFTTTDGSGLGLFHVKQIIDEMNGDITFVNNKNKGVTFKIIL